MVSLCCIVNIWLYLARRSCYFCILVRMKRNWGQPLTEDKLTLSSLRIFLSGLLVFASTENF